MSMIPPESIEKHYEEKVKYTSTRGRARKSLQEKTLYEKILITVHIANLRYLDLPKHNEKISIYQDCTTFQSP